MSHELLVLAVLFLAIAQLFSALKVWLVEKELKKLQGPSYRFIDPPSGDPRNLKPPWEG